MGVEFKNNARKVEQEFNTKAGVALNLIGSQAHRHTVDLTPRRTGNLAQHADWEVADDEKSVVVGFKHDNDPEKDPYYAIFVEEGSVHNVANHMLRKGTTEHDEEFKNICIKVFRG